MTHSELSKGLVLLFGPTLPDRIKKLENYLESHTKERAVNYINTSMQLSLGKDRK